MSRRHYMELGMGRTTITLEVDPAIQPAHSSREMPGSDENPASDVVQWFLDYYWIRHAISAETIASYRSNLLSLELWLSVFRFKTLLDANSKDLRDFLDVRYRSSDRQLRDLPSLSCIKRFYFFLVSVGLRADDPTEHVYVRTPQVARRELSLVPAKPSAG